MGDYTGPKIRPPDNTGAVLAIWFLSLGVPISVGLITGNIGLASALFPFTLLVLLSVYAIVRRFFGWPRIRSGDLWAIPWFLP